ncbi:GGDEF domain-containing protein [Mycolicibacterium mengxianglii]|uniref:GGDEF domain-containing protein n=1 Tax=Mycolicibacterium mengxianglii TaxID=2736649 RepID=UPI001E52A271|nr:GGDEF domain-containing protein [Mycolicibacterium mengxianglii]
MGNRSGAKPMLLDAHAVLQRRMLIGYLTLLTTLYGLASVDSYVITPDGYDTRGEVLGFLLAVLGLCCCLRSALQGPRYMIAVTCAGSAPIASLVFHDQLGAQVWAVVPLMFTAIFIRTWHQPTPARIAAGILAVAAVAALLIAPAPVPVLWVISYVMSIVLAAELFGLTSAALVDMALRDPLTALWNRAGVDRHVQKLVSDARRDGTQIAVIALDIDNFKLINDRDGHPAGDAALGALAQLLRERVPETAVIGRLGGDEFVVVIKGYNQTEAESLALRAVESPSVHVSFGVAAGHPDVGAFTSLFATADADLYRRKRQGKNNASAGQ